MASRAQADVETTDGRLHPAAPRWNIQQVVAAPGRNENETRLPVNELGAITIRAALAADMSIVDAGAVVGDVRPLSLTSRRRLRASTFAKAILDRLGALVGLAITAPLWPIIALLIKLDSRGPVIFCQERIGRDGKPFTIYKFRSMVADAEEMRADLSHLNETSGVFKIAEDPRITRFGRFLRRHYIDEVPQFLNVLLGDMSLVGPRPLVASEDALIEGVARQRLRVRPGITGPWQLRGPHQSPLRELAELDYQYASTWSIWIDIDLILCTIAQVLRRQGR